MLVLLVARPPRRCAGPSGARCWPARPRARRSRSPSTVAALPLQAVARERAKDVGLVTQSWGGWARDKAVSGAIGAIMAGLGAAAAVGADAPVAAPLVDARPGRRRGLRRREHLRGPVVLDPLFNTFKALPDGQARDDVLELAERAGVDVGEVYSVDASRRTTAANAYVTGLGQTKRVVLYDTLLENFTRDEVRLVVAHELAHVHYEDVLNGLLYLAIVTPFGLLRRGPADPPPGAATASPARPCCRRSRSACS